MIEQIQIKLQSIPDSTLADILNRDAALWIANVPSIDPITLELLSRLSTLPWKLVLSELTSKTFIDGIETASRKNDHFSRIRGFSHIVASDPSSRNLPIRALPVYMLNGVEGASDLSDSNALSQMASTRRYLNCLAKLQEASPSRLVIIGEDLASVSERIAEMWDSDFRSLLTFVMPATVDADAVVRRISTQADVRILTVVLQDLSTAIEDVLERVAKLTPDTSISIRLCSAQNELFDVDVTDAELIEQPILNRYELIKSRDLWRVSEADLSKEDLAAFFEKTKTSWRGYAAGLPWVPDKSIFARVLQSLERASRQGGDANKFLYVVSESGAGGTTLSRAIAFEAASKGYPVLLASSETTEPNATEVVSFINRVIDAVDSQPREQPDAWISAKEVPWLLVFDRDVWEGREQAISKFLAEIGASGRSCVILKVFGPLLSPEVGNVPTADELCRLSHELSRHEVLSLGKHLNRYLKSLGRTRDESEWLRFWELHKPDIDTGIAAFWISLEFWLKGHIDLGESVQSWVTHQFRKAPISQELRLLLLQIAAMSIERRSVPEALLDMPHEETLPLSYLLEQLRSEVPGLALVRQDLETERLWAIAHDILARYLVVGAYADRALMREMNLQHIESAVEFRLFLISKLTFRSALGEPRFLQYAIQFALKTLKLDEVDGNPEFFQYWRSVLGILEDFPDSIAESNRTFNHHVAISRRRVGKSEAFGATEKEKRGQLNKAIEQIEFAINDLDETPGDESNLNLYNSLALAYQDLAGFELQHSGPTELVSELRGKANEATLLALKESPSNSYVLETAARNLLQQGEVSSNESVISASQALGYVFQASALENAASRQYQLNRLANTALERLSSASSIEEVERLVDGQNPLGFLAKAWLTLLEGEASAGVGSIANVSQERKAKAYELLKSAPRHWLVIKLEYDLLAELHPKEFPEQLVLLDELDSLQEYRLPLQLVLEQTLLLHMVGRHQDAHNAFDILRRKIKAQNAILTVPQRLRWLLAPDKQSKLLCRAWVTDDLGYRPMAQVAELKNKRVPFIAQDFGSRRMAPGQQFRCHITFGPMGPFIKPPVGKKQ